MKHSVYVITCTATGLQYIGVSERHYRVRFGQHISDALSLHKDWPLACAIREHGPDAFDIECRGIFSTKREAHELEVRLIAELNTFHPGGYNLTLGGPGRSGMKMSKTWRRQHSARMKQAVAENGNWGSNTSSAQKAIWAAMSSTQRSARVRKSWRSRKGAADVRQAELLLDTYSRDRALYRVASELFGG